MTTRQVLIVGGIGGLLVPSMVLALIWFGVGGILNVGGTDLMYVFWPSSVMLVVGWRSTIPGVMITAASVVINCLLYMAVALSVGFPVLACCARQTGIRKTQIRASKYRAIGR